MITPVAFRKIIQDFYIQHGRELPWRKPEPSGKFDAYKILVSELMLQQTQVSRVRDKYEEFLQRFPDVSSLAQAPLGQVLTAWNGLGYNRRAKYLHEAARQLATKSTWTIGDLLACKGIGPNTAAAVCVYAYNQPHVFIETNIRTVYIHHYFPGQKDIADNVLIPLVGATIPQKQPREFYWGLMDYGSQLKRSIGNISRQSKHYAKQTAFVGSLRQLRGEVIRQLIQQARTTESLHNLINDSRLDTVLEHLQSEGLVQRKNQQYYLP